jgi:hypothetical protein
MKKSRIARIALFGALPIALFSQAADAHKLRVTGEAVAVADSKMTVTPTRDWNRLSTSPGKRAETWTVDGEQLNDLTFFAGIEAGQPLVKERSKKKDPLPKFKSGTLLIDVPELLESTYRTYKKIATFRTTSTEPNKFLGLDGVTFSYEYTDDDQITRRGEARATIVSGKLYMITYDAPRLYYYDRTLHEARAIMSSANL